QADQFQPISRPQLGECSRRRDARQAEEVRQDAEFVVVQLDPIAQLQRFFNDLPAVEMLAKVDVENSQCTGLAQHSSNCCPRNGISLSQSAETDGSNGRKQV